MKFLQLLGRINRIRDTEKQMLELKQMLIVATLERNTLTKPQQIAVLKSVVEEVLKLSNNNLDRLKSEILVEEETNDLLKSISLYNLL